jgi:hypothetical protein
VAQVLVAPLAGLVTNEGGASALVSVQLATQPAADVGIAVQSSDSTEASVAPAQLTFTPANWNVAQTVTATGVDDAVVDGDVAYVIEFASATSADPNYQGLNVPDAAALNRDDDGASVVVAPLAGLQTTEAGGTATFTVVLSSEPTADVTVGVVSNDVGEGVVAPASLVFTPANWSAPRTVTVTGVDDAMLDGDVAYGIVVGPPQSTDLVYDNLGGSTVAVSNLDNETLPSLLSASKRVIQPGTATLPVIYEIVLNNGGSGAQPDDADSDELIDVLPPELALLGATSSSGTLGSDVPSRTVRWNGTLAPNASVTITITASVVATDAGPISNVATVNYDGDGDGNSEATAPSDDPTTPGADATVFEFQGAGQGVIAPIVVPTLNEWMLVWLTLGIGLLAWRGLARRA